MSVEQPSSQGYDQVARWQDLEALFPEAEFSRKNGFYSGHLRASSELDVHATLKGLIDALIAREAGHGAVYRNTPS